MPRVQLRDDALVIGRLAISFQRTLRIPDDGDTYPLPPGLGSFPIRRVRDHARRVPAAWREQGGYFIPMYQREALWIWFSGAYWRPNAVKVGVGGVDAISGKTWDRKLRGRSQDYMVVPGQPWLDGIKAGKGIIRQFVAMPLGRGYTVEGQVTGREEKGGMQLAVFEPKPGRFPERPPHRRGMAGMYASGIVICESAVAELEMGLGAGGRMKQKIYPDRYGVDTWDAEQCTEVVVHIANSEMYEEITGEAAPPTPVSARTYTEYGLPWFELYDEGKGDLEPSEVLAGVKSVKEMDEAAGIGGAQDDSPVAVKGWQTVLVGGE